MQVESNDFRLSPPPPPLTVHIYTYARDLYNIYNMWCSYSTQMSIDYKIEMKLSVVYRTPLCSQKSRRDVFQYIFAPIALPASARDVVCVTMNRRSIAECCANSHFHRSLAIYI